MKRSFLLLACALLLVCLAPAQAQRGGGGGSVRYSGGGSAAARSSAARSSAGTARASTRATSRSTSSTPVSYQRPGNMPPPIGSRPSTLPVGHGRALYGGRSYYYYGGAYYADGYEGEVVGTGLPGYPSGSTGDSEPTGSSPAPLSGGRYVVVQPPLGVSVDELPYGATEVKKGLWEYSGVYYRPAYEGGQVQFVVSNP